MADISNYLYQIRNASRGETVRDSIVNAIQLMYDKGINAQTLQGHPAGYFCSIEDFNNALIKGILDGKNVYDERPTKNSQRAVSSNGLYEMYTNLYSQFAELLGG